MTDILKIYLLQRYTFENSLPNVVVPQESLTQCLTHQGDKSLKRAATEKGNALENTAL